MTMFASAREAFVRNSHLFIDDIRVPSDVGLSDNLYTIARTSAEAIAYIDRHGCPSLISFDHDLGGHDTTIPVVNWLIQRDLDRPGFIPAGFRYFVHSANPVGVQNITGKLEAYLSFRKAHES